MSRGVLLTAVVGLALWLPGAETAGHVLGAHHGDDQIDFAGDSHSPGPEINVHDPIEQVWGWLGEYRRQGNDAVLVRAGSVLEPLLKEQPGNVRARVAAAWLAQAEHRFVDAGKYLDTVLSKHPDHAQAWLLRASVALVTGDEAASKASCRAAASLVPPAVSTACFARVHSRRSTAPEAATLYTRLAAVVSAQAGADQGLTAWLHGVAGDLAVQSGQPARAIEHYRTALDAAWSVREQAGLAEALIISGQPAEAVELISADAVAPALVVRRLLAEKWLGVGPDPGALSRVDSRFRIWIGNGEFQHAREMALFYVFLVPDLPLARQLALRNFERQRELEDLALLCRVVGAPGDGEAHCATAAWPLLNG